MKYVGALESTCNSRNGIYRAHSLTLVIQMRASPLREDHEWLIEGTLVTDLSRYQSIIPI